MQNKQNFLLILISIFIGIFSIEFFFQFKYLDIKKKYRLSLHENRFMIFDEGLVFSNIEKIFKYEPRKVIRSKAYYFVDNVWHKEYDYEITTNNFGLVQKNDIKKNIPSILFLGDSFVEGQGSSAWFDNFNGKFKDFQLINGGILGTGPQQFELLESHISKEYNVEKVLFFYIGDDLRRNIFNISKKSLNCLENHKNCRGNENFYGFPFKKKDPEKFLNDLYDYRLKQKQDILLTKKIKNFVKDFLKNLNTVKIVNNFLKQKFYYSKNEYIQRNFQSIKNLYEKYEDAIIFIQLTNKNEIIYGKEYDTFYAENFIKSFSNNHFNCDFNKDIKSFYKIDMHPNKGGYEHLYKCVKEILNNQI